MRISKVTPINEKADPEAGIEVFVGEYREIEHGWYQTDIASLEAELEGAGIDYREYHLMRKAVGFESGLIAGLFIWSVAEAFKILAAWLPARAGRRVRIKFKNGTEIEASTIKQLEEIREKFVSSAEEDDGASSD